MRSGEKYILNLLEDVYPGEMSLKELTSISGYSRGYAYRRIHRMEERGWVRVRKSGEELYIRLNL